MNLANYIPAFEHTLAVLGALLFINQLRLARQNKQGLYEVQAAIVEVAAQSTQTEQTLEAFAEIAENSENLITQCGGDLRSEARRITTVKEDLLACREISRETARRLEKEVELRGTQVLNLAGDVVALQDRLKALNTGALEEALVQASLISDRAKEASERINAVADEAIKEASNQAIGAVRQMVQNMTLGKQTENEKRLLRLEKACGPLPEIPRGARISPLYGNTLDSSGPQHIASAGDINEA